MKAARQGDGPGAIDLLEEAVHALRGAPVKLLAFYAIGTLPFILALLYFWAEMSRGAFAREHEGTYPAALALVFLWMKCWQSVFAAEMRARLIGRESTPWTWKRLARVGATQAALQPLALFALPLGAVAVLPFGWLYAYFQNLTVVADEAESISAASKEAAAQASVPLGQPYLMVAILSVFALFVWLNLALFMAMLPGLLKSILGLDNEYTRAGMLNVFNTTYLAGTVALTYLCVDPLAKTAYALRCFYGQSIKSGDDLTAGLLRARNMALGVFAVLICLAPATFAASAKSSVSTAQLNQSIDETLKEPQFAWRMPRKAEEARDANENWLARMLRSFVDAVIQCLKWMGHTIAELFRWIGHQLQKLWPNDFGSQSGSNSGFSWATFLQTLVFLLIATIVAFLSVLIYRIIKSRNKPPIIMATAVVATPDLNDETVAASDLPEDRWLALAQEMIAQGNLRLALRAFYLAGLAHLGQRELIAVSLFKSNREYELELRRKGRVAPEAMTAFSDNVAAFDRVWYGFYDVTADTLNQFEANLQQIRAC